MNKKYSLLILFAFLVCLSAESQPFFAIKGGFNYSNVVSSSESSNPRSYLPGYNVGIFAKFKISDEMNLSPEISFTTKGYKYEVVFSNGDKETARNITYYLTLPILVDYNISSNLSLSLGPELSFLTAAKNKILDMSYQHTDFFRSVDVGLTGSFSYVIIPRVLLGFRYTHGFLSAIKEIAVLDSDGEIIRFESVYEPNRSFQLFLAFQVK